MRGTRTLLMIGVAAWVVLLPSGSHAQALAESGATGPTISNIGEEIIVTARRQAESIDKVPVAVSVLSGEALTNQSALNISDLKRLAPSINFGVSARGGVPQMSIRGLGSGDTTGATDPTVGVYFNDIILQRPNGILSSLYDVESVQVLRGPQGTLFGRNTIGGAILISSRKPGEEIGGYLSGSYGNYDFMRLQGALNLPVVEGTQLRFAGNINRRDGYVISLANGQDQNNLHDEGARVSMRNEYGALEVNTVVDYFHENSTSGLGGTAAGLYPVGARTGGIVINPINQIADGGNRGAVEAAGALSARNIYRNYSEPVFNRVKATTVSNTIAYEADDHITVKNIFGYRKVKAESLNDFDASAARLLTSTVFSDTRQITNEFQVLGEWDRFNAIAGAYYFQEKGSDLISTIVAIPLVSVNNPGAENFTGGDIRNKAYSGFLAGTLSLTDRLKLGGGVRYTKDKRFVDLQSYVLLNPTTTPNATCLIGTVSSFQPGAGSGGEDVYITTPADPCSLERSISSSAVTYSVDLNWQVTDDLLLYAAHRKGYHSASLNIRATFPIEGDYADPETLKDVELGLKSKFWLGAGQGRFNVAAYYGWFDDIQRLSSIPAIIQNNVRRVPSSLINAASARISGIETELSITPIDGLEISGYFAYNRTKYRRFFDPSFNPPLDRSSDLFAFAPKYTGGATARYTRQIGEIGEGAIQINYFGTSRFNSNLGGGGPLFSIQDGYSLLNARLELNDIAGQGLDAALFVDNLTDKKYFQGGNAVPSLGAASRVPGAPRMYGLTLRYRFGSER